MKEKYTFEYLESYLDQSLPASEKAELENNLQQDIELREELARHQQTRQLVRQMAAEETREKVGKIFREQQANKRKSSSPFLRIAAGVAILLTIGLGYILSLPSANPQELAATYFEPFPDRVTTMSADNDVSLNTAMDAYNQGDYTTASNEFEQLSKDGSQQEIIDLYAGIAAMQANNTQLAISKLNHLHQESNDYGEVASWYLALTYLQQEETDKARPILQALVEAEGYRASSAQTLLKSLN